jgi:EAL domain-containing protein (putative c-di-GMP-specific phosphodiesterase class I)
VQSAIRAIEYGVFRYLTKPISASQVLEAVTRAVHLGRYSRLRREAHDMFGKEGFAIGDRTGLEVGFRQAMKGLYMAYQPIVDVVGNRVYAYEALMRSGGGVLRSPLDILSAAEKLGRLPELARIIRQRVAGSIAALPADTLLFVNMHPFDLTDPSLLTFDNPLIPAASRIVLEMTERASLDDVPDAPRRIESLRSIGFRIALDDLGAGYAGLSSFATMNPDVVKLDLALVQGVDKSPRRARLITSMTQLCKDLGSRVIAEGVETEAEKETLITCGCDLLQGYLFGRPVREFLTWPR